MRASANWLILRQPCNPSTTHYPAALFFCLFTNTTSPVNPNKSENMSDPLSLISSISGIISLADLIITKAAKLYISTRDCPQEIKALVDETSSLSGLLAALDRRVLALQQANGLKQHYVQVPVTAMILDDCEQTLNSVVAVIMKSEPKPGESVRNTGKRLLWNFRKDEVVELIAKLERCKTNLQIALSLDGM